MGEGSIRWFRVDGVRGVEVMDVRGVRRQWAHHHETYTLCAVDQVENNQDVPWLYRGRQFIMRRGGVQLMEPSEFHCTVHEAPAASFGVILIEKERMLELLSLARGYTATAPALGLPQSYDPTVESSVHGALRALRTADAGDSEDALLGLANSLCVGRVFERQFAETRGRERDSVRKARDLLQDSWADPVTVSTIVRTVGTPASTLSHAFKKKFGMGLRQYRRRVRLERCRRMLWQSDQPVTHVAAMCGFFDPATFCHSFKDFFGMTPSEYRGSVITKLSSTWAEHERGR